MLAFADLERSMQTHSCRFSAPPTRYTKYAQVFVAFQWYGEEIIRHAYKVQYFLVCSTTTLVPVWEAGLSASRAARQSRLEQP
eukprot:scaffold119124_cov17-Prasinocladus_malaysianus.AAC.1